MKTFTDHIEYVKKQPHHVRRSIAFGVSGAFTVFVGIVWISGSLVSGAFRIQGSSFADARNTEVQVAAPSNTNLAGVAAAFSPAQPPSIQIVDISSSSEKTQASEPTVIPF